MTTKPLTNIKSFITVLLRSGDVVRCPCGQRLAQKMVSGETWYVCRSCKDTVKVIVE